MDAANFVAKNAAHPEHRPIKCQRLEHVRENSFRPLSLHHTCPGRTAAFERSKAEGVETAAFATFQTQRQDRIGAILGDKQPAVQSST